MSPLRRFRRWGRDMIIRFADWHENRTRAAAIQKFVGEGAPTDMDHCLLVPEEDIPGMPDADGKLSLLREKLEGRNAREDAGLPVVQGLPTTTERPMPVFRRDGQVHNFNAAGFGRKFTQKQFDARHEGYRPVPRRGSHTIDETPEDPNETSESPDFSTDMNFNTSDDSPSKG